LTGQFSANGISTRQAAELAIKDINAQGGLLVDGVRRPIKLIYGDDQDNPEIAVNVAKRMINQDKVVALVGLPFSRLAIPVANVAEQAHIPMISSTSTNPETTAGKKYVFRVTFTDPFQGTVMAQFARNDLKVERAAVLYDQASDYNRGIAEVFKQAFTADGGTIVAFEPYVTGETDFRASLARIKANDAQVLFLPNYYTEVPVQAAQARELGLDIPLLGSDGWDINALAALPDLDGSFISQSWHPDTANPPAQAFIKAYQAAYNGALPYDIEANTYDAFGILFQAIQNQKSSDPEAIRQGLANLSYTGVTGAINYRDSGDPVKSAVIVQFKDGTNIFYQSVNPR
jgi:branched-chain amino acid transport system substrate-binding protein